MSCGGGTPTFRLLDAFVGWDPFSAANLSGLDNAEGVRLSQETRDAVDPGAILAYLPPPRLTRGCGPCEWYLVTPVPPAPRLLRRYSCTRDWLQVWSEACDPGLFVDPIAVVARGHHVAVADRGADAIWIWTQGGERRTAAIHLKQPGPIAFTPWGELLVTTRESRQILRFDLTGESRGPLGVVSPKKEEIDRIAVSDDCTIWLVTRTANGMLKLWSTHRKNTQFKPALVEDLAKAFKPTGLIAASEVGFCLEEPGPDGSSITICYNWYGRPIDKAEIKQPPPPRRHTQGQLLTQAIDSGLPRCRWHRVRIDADVPPGTMLAVAVATSEISDPPRQGDKNASPGWEKFEPGIPHPQDWSPKPDGLSLTNRSLDFLIDQPPGRYLFLRLRLTGDAKATPVVRRIRLDFPRITSLEFLPPVYRERPEAEDFTERFLSLFDASIANLDRAIERTPALLDPDGVPDELLPWLGSFLDLAFDPAWESERRRKILKAVPELYRQRGTKAGLSKAIDLVFDTKPAIQELAMERNWGGLRAGTRLGEVRLFGKARARLRLGNSPLGGAPLRSFGNPDHDPFAAQAYRFRVLVPPSRKLSPADQNRLERLVDSQKPAHTLASVRVGGTGFVLGSWSAVGIDTAFAPLPPPVLGVNVRLRRMSVLWSGPHGPRTGITLGTTAVVGVKTIVE